MSCWRLVSRLRPQCRARVRLVSCRFATYSAQSLCLKRDFSITKISCQLSSSAIEESNPSSVNDEDQKPHETNSDIAQPSTPVEGLDGPLGADKDAVIKSKIIFNTYLYKVDPDQIWLRRKLLEMKQARHAVENIAEQGYAPMQASVLKYLSEDVAKIDDEIKETDAESESPTEVEENVHFPFAGGDTFETDKEEYEVPTKHLPRRVRIEKLKALNSDETLRDKFQKAIDERWMSDYEHFREGNLKPWQKMYGTPMREVPVSKIPCGGCGAYLQCQESAIPGYLPSELFLHMSSNELKTITCQRCHFLKNYEIALDVTVPSAKYPAVLDEISRRKGLIVLIIDLLDFPCSIWPGMVDIIGEKTPVIVVGNKVDLLPGDHVGYLGHIKQVLKKSLDNHGLRKIKLKNIHLISARSGFGVEQLITELQKMSEYKGDVFLLGCTNVGKSSLFNCLLQSDMCKVQAVDLIQRATTSRWPNTTLNLLKFPMMRPMGWKLLQREERLNKESTWRVERRLRAIQLNKKFIYHMPSLMEFVGRTFLPTKDNEQNARDIFSARPVAGKTKKLGLDENDPAFKDSRWCYDTPGVANPDQILPLLTTEELLDVLPSSSYVPRTFRLRLGQSIFIGGLARIDFLEGAEQFVWITIFASEKLPVTFVWTYDADTVYKYALGTEVLRVPHSGASRLAHWPGLKAAPRPYTLFSEKEDRSGADLVLSSIGWISVTTNAMKKVTLLPWTPEGRGIYFRVPALIPFAVNFRGPRITGTPMYSTRRSEPPRDHAELIAEAQDD